MFYRNWKEVNILVNIKFLKKFSIFLLIINLISTPVFSTTIYTSGGFYGLKDKNGKVVLNPQYQSIQQLSYTPSKKIIIPMHAMDEVEIKKLDLYKIKKNGLWGIANSNGHTTHECKYKNIEADGNGDVVFILNDGTKEYAHPVLNIAKSARDTLVTVVGLPVTLLGTVMIPIEAVSKAGRAK